MDRIQESSDVIMDRVRNDRKDFEEKVNRIYSEHLLVDGLIGEGEDCDFKNVYSYTKHKLRGVHEDLLQKAKDLKAFKVDVGIF